MIQFRIHHKIALIFIFIIACLLTGTFLYLNKSFQQYTYESIRQDLAQKVSLARAFVEKSPKNIDPDRMADEISDNLQLRVTIIDDQGVVRGDSDFDQNGIDALENHLYRPEVQNALNMDYGESRRFSTSTQQDFLYIATKCEKNGFNGFVRLALSLEEIAVVSRRVNRILVASFLFAFILFVVASYLASLLISRPIETIAQGARRIAAGNFDNRIFVAGYDEISDLARAFNEMAQHIKDYINNVEVGKLQLEAVFSSMTEGVLVVDEHGKIFLMNHALRVLLNIIGDPIGKRPIELIRNAEIQEMIADVQFGESHGSLKEIEFLVPDQRIMHVQSMPIKREGKVSGVVVVFHDITELRRLENIRKEFVANVSHELRTPVASIKGYAETLIDGALKDKATAEDFTRIILTDAERLAKLIEDLLDLSSIESGNMLKEVSECPLPSLLDRVLESIQVQANAKNVQIRVSGLDDKIIIKGHELSLFRLFLNLIENAVKYNKENGRVDIELKPSGQMVEIKIKDTGIGISDQDLPRIFERFYRVDKAHSRQLGGTGLGLSIVKHIVQAHGGTIFVKSTLGEGSVFVVNLPCI